MNEAKFRSLDLNLLYILYILLEERNVTRTALRLGLSQSAISHSLNKLRNYFDDQLLVKTRQGMVPTSVAEELTGRLRIVMGQIAGLTRGGKFDPSSACGNFRVAASDYGAGIILPLLIERLSIVAPGIKIDCSTLSPNFEQELENGLIDFAFGAYKPVSDLSNEVIFYDRYIGLLRSDHTLLKQKITKASLLKFKHAFIKVATNTRRKDEIFKSLGIDFSKEIQMQIPYYVVAPLIVERSDMILIMPEMGAKLMAKLVDIVIFELPMKTQSYPYYQTWHPRRQEDPMHRWLRTQVKEVCDHLECYYNPQRNDFDLTKLPQYMAHVNTEPARQ